jgi:hypothetical protein
MYSIVNTAYGIHITNNLAEKMSLYVNARMGKGREFMAKMRTPKDWRDDLGETIHPCQANTDLDQLPVILGVEMDWWNCEDVQPLSQIRMTPNEGEIAEFTRILQSIRTTFPELEGFDFGTPEVILYGSTS